MIIRKDVVNYAYLRPGDAYQYAPMRPGDADFETLGTSLHFVSIRFGKAPVFIVYSVAEN